MEFKALDSVLRTTNDRDEKVSISMKCSDMDRLVPENLGVTAAIVENVMFCHQEESNWPMQVRFSLWLSLSLTVISAYLPISIKLAITLLSSNTLLLITFDPSKTGSIYLKEKVRRCFRVHEVHQSTGSVYQGKVSYYFQWVSAIPTNT